MGLRYLKAITQIIDEQIMQELIFKVFPWETRAYVFEFGSLKNVFVEWSDEIITSGNIYEGRVDSISSSLRRIPQHWYK